jgi:hypothetical protein
VLKDTGNLWVTEGEQFHGNPIRPSIQGLHSLPDTKSGLFIDILFQGLIIMAERINYIVVPDGIAADKNGKPIKAPSFVYKQVLDYVLHVSREGDAIYLAPANFCGGKTEHALAFEYIMQAKRRNIDVYCPSVSFTTYIDTYGNAKHLKAFLHENITSLSFDLVCAYIHSYRAVYCFKQEGFHINKIHRVYYRVTGENIVDRWWYYKYKPVHCIYELLAFIRDMFHRCG